MTFCSNFWYISKNPVTSPQALVTTVFFFHHEKFYDLIMR
jgi:hypothetical protein